MPDAPGSEQPGATLAALASSRYLNERTAAAIARMLRGKPPGTPAGSDVNLALELNVSRTTVGKAKQKLARLGLLAKSDDNTYRTAPPRPPEEARPDASRA